MFKTNEGNGDRIFRAILGAVLVAAFFMTSGTLSWVLLVVGIVALFTAVTGFCALYALLGINTCKLKA